jgi:hypothetical protein
MLSEGSSMKFRHWIIAGSVPLYIGRMASFGMGCIRSPAARETAA